MRYHLFDSRAWLVAAVFVTFVCHSLSNAQLVDDKSERTNVSVDVYYESLCSDSMRWIVNQLIPSYSELKNHLHITLIPYGKATHARESETGPWQFLCQHGSAECRGNKAQACAIHSIQTSEEAQKQQQLTVKLVGCAMSARNPSTAVPQCAQDIGLTEGTQKLINECIESSFGDDLLAANGDKTHNLQPPLRFVPTIIINGVYSKENQDVALNNFSKLICHHLTEQEKPSICSSVN
ncbi:Gamma-interferon-inducible lysosomal thiol reductase [Camponotus floridanus]|uniref:Gamma-interferon-inducible lysosomal thiol reductase n=2 Tax=Camponotus floridanus TaxID=104421 RepID=E2AU22_CAMFO|nr:Gamma-interferon-inducible lysosomal thiol reductase [Camponotus floridanus]